MLTTHMSPGVRVAQPALERRLQARRPDATLPGKLEGWLFALRRFPTRLVREYRGLGELLPVDESAYITWS